MAKARSKKDKLALLDLVAKLGNVSVACRAAGFSRDSYYRIKKAYDDGGAEALNHSGDNNPLMKRSVSDDAEKAIIRMSLEDPCLGRHKVSELLKEQGLNVSPEGVGNVWVGHNIETFEDRVNALIDHLSRKKGVMSETQLKALKKSIKVGALSKVGKEGPAGMNMEWEQRLKFEALISELSANFINLPVDRIDAEIENGQKLVCRALGLYRSVFAELSSDRHQLLSTHIWSAKEISDWVPKIFDDKWGYFIASLLKGETVLISNLDELPEETMYAKSIMQKIGLMAVVCLPLTIGDNIMGCISWESYGIERSWPKELVERLRLISEVFAHALSRKRAEEALRQSLAEIEKLKDQLQAENLYLKDEIKLDHKHSKIVGRNDFLIEVLNKVEQVAGTSSTVLILGETGTGKGLLAQEIHALSPRKDRPMVQVNCSALPSTLIESELFGHEKGAYTGAVSKKIGRFELANGSTLFLDEIGDLPVELQPKLLRVLQEGKLERLGGSETIAVDVRVIAATNHDLARAIAEGKFRTDLYYRLSVFPITVPPLRERINDIPLLVRSFVREYSSQMGKTIDAIPGASLKALCRYDWPGNIRELRNVIERAMIISKGDTLQIQLPETSNPKTSDIETLDDIQRTHILKVLEKTHGRLSGERGAARLLGINAKTLEARMKRLNIQRKNKFS